MNRETVKTKRRYNRIARFYDFFESPIEKRHFSSWRRALLEGIKGLILEIGVGTGKNLPYYGNGCVVIGIDISEEMLKRAVPRTKGLKGSYAFLLADAEKLPFKNDSFDFIVGTYILCSIPNPVVALKEMRKVIKERGEVRLLEHVLSKNKLVAFLEWLHNPLTRHLWGFNVNRDTITNIRKAGLRIVREENLFLGDVFKRVIVTRPTLKVRV